MKLLSLQDHNLAVSLAVRTENGVIGTAGAPAEVPQTVAGVAAK